MDRSFEQIRTEVLELDLESRRLLAEEIEHTLVENETEFDEEWRREIKRRIEKIDCGEAAFVSEEEFFVRGHAMIEEAKRAQK